MKIVNSLVVRYRGSYFIEEDAASIAANGRCRKPFAVADNYTESGARQLARAELRRLAGLREQVTATGETGGLFTPGQPGAPYRDVWPGDRVRVTQWDDSLAYERVESIAMEQRESDKVDFSLEIESKQDSLQRRLVTNSRVAARGLLGGQSERVAPIREADGQVDSGYLEGQDVSWAPSLFEVSESPAYSFQRAVRPYLVRFTWVKPCTTWSACQVRKNGVPLNVVYYNSSATTILVPPLTGSMWGLIYGVVVAPDIEVLTLAVTVAGAEGGYFAASINTAVVHTS